MASRAELLTFVAQGRGTALGDIWIAFLHATRTELTEAMVLSEPGNETEQARGAIMGITKILEDVAAMSARTESTGLEDEPLSTPTSPELL